MSSQSSTIAEDFKLGSKGSRTVPAFAALGPGQRLQPSAYDPGPLPTGEVKVAVTHCGVCHTDLHLIDKQLGTETYPLVPGHEVIGTIIALGDAVDGRTIGQCVGVGFQRGACYAAERHCVPLRFSSGTREFAGVPHDVHATAVVLWKLRRHALRDRADAPFRDAAQHSHDD